MAQYKTYTPDGHTLSDMRSCLQKSIRRGDAVVAAYAARQIWEKYNAYFWKTVITISAEDCYGCVTKEILALRDAEYETRNTKTGERSRIYFCKAVTLLVRCEKSRDSDYMACVLAKLDKKVDLSGYEDVMNAEIPFELPEYVYDCHTYKGRALGKTRQDFFKSEYESLANRQMGLFDGWDWTEGE